MLFVEKLQNINSLNIAIETDQVDINVKEEAILIPFIDPIVLPCKVKPGSARITFSNSWAYIQLQTLQNVSTSVNPDSPLQMPVHLQCGNCQELILPHSHNLEKIISLPSDYWYEMIDCWSCHNEDYSTLPGQQGGLILAQKKTLMVGLSYFTIHPDSINLSSLALEYSGREVCI
jgi:hypothetical protein